jgi:hypothetical protein
MFKRLSFTRMIRSFQTFRMIPTKKNCLTARPLSRKFSVKGKLNYITAILVHLLPVYLLHFHYLYPKGNSDKCRRVTYFHKNVGTVSQEAVHLKNAKF